MGEAEEEGNRKGMGKIGKERNGFAGPMSGCFLRACDTHLRFHRDKMALSADQLERCVHGVGQCPPTD